MNHKSRRPVRKGATSASPSQTSTIAIKVVRKKDTTVVVEGNDALPDDLFDGLYSEQIGGVTNVVIEPPFNPSLLQHFVTHNGILNQMVEVMEVNIDGTGHSIDTITEGGPEDETEKMILDDFFKEPFPGKSMIQIRRAIRRDKESIGYGVMEVMRSLDGELQIINNLDAATVRLVKLDDPVPVTRTLRRGGKEVSVSLSMRERRFVQVIGARKLYFKEFGASRDLDKVTGQWADVGATLPADRKASEILYFPSKKEARTPYGVPRWINNLPAVLGSRKAEELNLDYFDSNGIPPALVIVEGGTLTPGVAENIRNQMNGKAGHRVAVVEATSSSGSLDSSGTVRVRVERFSSERSGDSMFKGYMTDCASAIQAAFRVPSMFVGKSGDLNFATAYTSYMVAEAQVFFPERDDFDAVINNTVVRALGITKYKFRSLPLTIIDVANQLKAVELGVTNNIVSGEEAVSALNELTGLALKYTKIAAPPVVTASPLQIKQPPAMEGTKTVGNPSPLDVAGPVAMKAERAVELIKLAQEWVSVGQSTSAKAVARKHEIATEAQELTQEELVVFQSTLSAVLFRGAQDEGITELCSCLMPGA